MRSKRVTTLILAVLGVLLLILPGLVGCSSKEEGTEKVIKIGILADLTGMAAEAMNPTMNTMEEYITSVVPEVNPLPGVKVKFIPFNTEGQYAKVPNGYLTLQAQGIDMIVIPNAADRDILRSEGKFPADEIVCVGNQGEESSLSDPWMTSTQSTVQSQGEAIMLWIMKTWDYSKGKPKVGHIGYQLTTSDYYQEGIDRVLAAYPDKFQWVSFQKGLTTTLDWTTQVDNLKTCDYVAVSMAASPMSGFVSQARARGYEGAFVSGNEGFPGFWDLVTPKVPVSSQDNFYYVAWWPWWGEDVSTIDDLTQYLQDKHPDTAESLMKSSAPISGWGLGILIEDIIRRAIASVGAENVDGVALKDAMTETNLDVPGYGNTWKASPNNNAMGWAQRAFEWNAAEGKWQAVTDWISPLSTPVD